MAKRRMNNDKLLSITKYIVEQYKIIQPIRIQKILYFLYLDYLKKSGGEKLFEDEFQAWIHGPVVPKVFHYIKNNGFNFEVEYGTFFMVVAELNVTTKKFIDKNIQKYLAFDSSSLIEKSHLTEPWIKSRNGLKIDEISTKVIDFYDLKEYSKFYEYSSLQ